MAVVERTIGTGQTYTTIDLWEDATNLNGGADIWKGVISTNEALDGPVIIDGGGTNNTTSYVWLTVAEANRHAGVWTTSKARLTYTGGNTAAIQIDSDYVRIDWLQIHRPTSGSIGPSDEGIRITATAETGCLISRNIIWTDDSSTSNDTDGIYTGGWGITSLFIDHNVVYGWQRCAVNLQQHLSTSTRNVTATLDHNTLAFSGSSSSYDAPLGIHQEAGTTTVTAYNNLILRTEPDVNRDVGIDDGAGGDVVTMAGSHNCFNTVIEVGTGTTNLNWTSTTAASAGIVATDTANAAIITNATKNPVSAATDFTPQDLANNVLLTNGTDRQGSEPDARQDFSIDITGGARGTTDVDIGPFQITSGATGATVTPATIAATASLPAALVGVGIAPATTAATASVPAALVGTGAAPATTAATTALPQAAVGVGTAPATTAATVALPAAAASVGAAPATIAATAALPQATASEASIVAPATIAATVATPQAAVSVEAAPATTAATVALPQATAETGTIAAPATTAVTVATPQAAVSVGAAPATTALTVALPLVADVGEGGNATPTPATIAATGALPQAAVSVEAAPATTAATAALPQATASEASIVAPATIAATGALPQAVVSVGAAPATLAATVALPQPGAAVGAAPATIAATGALPQATASEASIVTPATVAAVGALPQAAVSIGVAPATIAVVTTLPLVDLAGEILVGSNPITVEIRDVGHTVTASDAGHTITVQETH